MATGSPPGIKQPGRGFGHPTPSKAKVKGVELYTSTKRFELGKTDYSFGTLTGLQFGRSAV